MKQSNQYLLYLDGSLGCQGTLFTGADCGLAPDVAQLPYA